MEPSGHISPGGKEPTDPPALRHEIEKAMNGLAAATAAHDSTWHLAEADWSLDQQVGNLVFTTPQGMQAVAPAQIIGTYNTQDGTWLWAWDHPSVEPSLAKDAKKMLAYGQRHGYAKLTTRKLQITEAEAWELTALAFLICDANGAYRGPAGTALVFMTFGEVQLSKAT
jgi:hypothetical protein